MYYTETTFLVFWFVKKKVSWLTVKKILNKLMFNNIKRW